MFRNKKVLICVVGILIVLLLGAGIGNLFGQLGGKNAIVRRENASANEQERDDTDWEDLLQYEGRNYKKNPDITTILFMGIDDKPTQHLSTLGTESHADSIVLFIVNKAEKTVKILEISRDTMVEADVYNNDGEYLNSTHMQINMQYAYGDNGARSCQITKKTVSRLLYGIAVDYYFALTIDGMKAVTEAMGGITLTMPEDYSAIYQAYTKGAVVTIGPSEVEHFVRYRDTDVAGRSEDRIERQSWFLMELFRQMKNRKEEVGVKALFDAAKPYLETDLDVNMIQQLSGCKFSEETEKVPVEVKEGSSYDEYYVDEAALQKLLVNLFYLPAD